VSCRLYKAGELTEKRKDRVVIRELLPDPLPGLHLERLSLPAGAWMRGSPHTRGTREYLTCERGQLVLATAGERHMLDPGDVLVFPGDQRHAYHNSGDEEAVGYSALVLTAPA
jgi:quercetin dioxygenase-like cupin family protein